MRLTLLTTATTATTVATVVAAALSVAGPAAAGTSPDRAPLVRAAAGRAVPGSYIVVMKDGVSASARTRASARVSADGGTVGRRFDHALHGFTARLDAAGLAALRTDPRVAYVEQDQRISVDTTQASATWGLDRIDQAGLPLSGTYTYDQTGAGVTAFIVDTGIRATHTELSGRVGAGFTAVADGHGTDDCNGHGTHVSGTVGGTTYGVAKAVTLVPVRVLGCDGSGTTSGVISGVDWVTAHHSGPSVANMSLGGGASTALDSAVATAVSSGVVFAVAAGNDNVDACGGSPARVPSALTVGSTTSTDARSSFSNTGACLDLFAPGSGITSSWNTSDTATNTISGTSMATPHVTGAAALYLQGHPSATPAAVSAAIVGAAVTGKVTGAGTGSPNRLLQTVVTSTPPSGNLLRNPGFESGNTAWTATAGVITSSTRRPARTGTWKAWLDGNGTTATESVAQAVTIPAATSATFSFYLRVDTAETTASAAFDRLKVQVVSSGTTTTLATYSNLNKGTAFVKRSFDLSAYTGKAVTVKLVGTEDASLQTSFVVDDTALVTG